MKWPCKILSGEVGQRSLPEHDGGAEEEEQSRGAVANPAAPLDLGILSLDDEDLTLVQFNELLYAKMHPSL